MCDAVVVNYRRRNRTIANSSTLSFVCFWFCCVDVCLSIRVVVTKFRRCDSQLCVGVVHTWHPSRLAYSRRTTCNEKASIFFSESAVSLSYDVCFSIFLKFNAVWLCVLNCAARRRAVSRLRVSGVHTARIVLLLSFGVQMTHHTKIA